MCLGDSETMQLTARQVVERLARKTEKEQNLRLRNAVGTLRDDRPFRVASRWFNSERHSLAAENPKEAAGRAKLPLQLCPPEAERLMAMALEHGAKKYGAWNWRDAGINLMTYIGAMRRHIAAIHAGEDMDPDSGLPHIAHVLAGAAIVADASAVGTLRDDRPFRVASRETGVDGGLNDDQGDTGAGSGHYDRLGG